MQTATTTIEDLEASLATQQRAIADIQQRLDATEARRNISFSKARDSQRNDTEKQLEQSAEAERELVALRASRRELDMQLYFDNEQADGLRRDQSLHAALGGRELPTAVVPSDRRALEQEHRVRRQRFADLFRDAAVACEAVLVVEAALSAHDVVPVMRLAPPVALRVVNERSLFREWIAGALVAGLVK